jgi:hypothetical protein
VVTRRPTLGRRFEVVVVTGLGKPTGCETRRIVVVVGLLIVVALAVFRVIGRGDDHYCSVCALNDCERSAAPQQRHPG